MTSRRLLSGLALAAALLSPAALMAQGAPTPAPAAPAQQQQRPNVLVWVLDDVGFAQLSCFGGLVPTPNIDRVASRGLRYTNYHTPPVCSAARAALLTGRNSHSVHIGGHTAVARDYPGYDGLIPPGAGTVAENFHQAGYRTFALGKWDHLPMEEMTPAGPFRYWPTGQGFDRFYGFLSAETDNFEPLLWSNNSPVPRPAGADYHLSADLADRAVAMIDTRSSTDTPAPFFLYFATGAAHAPHHAPADWIARFKGRFDMGWDKARAQILKNQKALGIVARNTQLPPRPEAMADWDTLSPPEKALHARQMEVFAAALSYADAQFGRMLDALERRGELDNTLIVIVSDNGASAEGGPAGSYNELLFAGAGQPTAQQNLPFLDRWGGPETHPHYALGWAVAGNTPNRNYKQTTYEGGTRTPLVIAWPKGIAARGELRGQFVHASDITPTLLAAAGVEPARTVNNVAQVPFEGHDLRVTFATTAPTGPRSQYFEMFGHKGLWADGWKIVTHSKLETWNMYGPGRIDRPWELYDLTRDPGESRDLAAAMPAKVAELDSAFQAQAERFHVNPIADQAMMAREAAPKAAADFARRKGTYSYGVPVSRVARPNSPPFERGAFTMRAEVTVPAGGGNGPVFAQGGHMGGTALWLDHGRPVLAFRTMAGALTELRGQDVLPAGASTIEMAMAPADPANPRGGASRVTLSVGGRVLIESTGPFRAISGETFDMGRDDGSAVGSYAPGTVLDGSVRNMEFRFR